MCTCGIDIATQQATPAMHSRVCTAPADMPSTSGWPEPPTAAATLPAAGTACTSTGGLRRSTIASGSIDSTQNTPMPM